MYCEIVNGMKKRYFHDFNSQVKVVLYHVISTLKVKALSNCYVQELKVENTKLKTRVMTLSGCKILFSMILSQPFDFPFAFFEYSITIFYSNETLVINR